MSVRLRIAILVLVTGFAWLYFDVAAALLIALFLVLLHFAPRLLGALALQLFTAPFVSLVLRTMPFFTKVRVWVRARTRVVSERVRGWWQALPDWLRAVLTIVPFALALVVVLAGEVLIALFALFAALFPSLAALFIALMPGFGATLVKITAGRFVAKRFRSVWVWVPAAPREWCERQSARVRYRLMHYVAPSRREAFLRHRRLWEHRRGKRPDPGGAANAS